MLGATAEVSAIGIELRLLQLRVLRRGFFQNGDVGVGVFPKVHDSGAGFDLTGAGNEHGLGLISMKERLKLVEGGFSIESKPQSGTTILATVPLAKGMTSEAAVA